MLKHIVIPGNNLSSTQLIKTKYNFAKVKQILTINTCKLCTLPPMVDMYVSALDRLEDRANGDI